MRLTPVEVIGANMHFSSEGRDLKYDRGRPKSCLSTNLAILDVINSVS